MPVSNPDPIPARRDLSRPILFGLTVFLLVAFAWTYVTMRNRINDLRAGAAEATESQAGAVSAPAVSASAAVTPLGDYHVLNAHEHLFQMKHLDKYLAAAHRAGIARTLMVASSEFTLKGAGFDPRQGNDWNTREVLNAQQAQPGEIIAYCTVHPDDPDKPALLQTYRNDGAAGVKLYTGHSNFYDRPLDAEEMVPLYEYCQANNYPICWHINLSIENYADEFERVMSRFPKLKVIVPHFGVTFYRPGNPAWDRFWVLVDKYPGLYTDCSWGTRQILVQGLEVVSANTDIFRKAFIKYQDRILWGTDMVVTGNQEKTDAWIESILVACRSMLEKDVYYFWLAATGSPYAYAAAKNTYGRLNGLALPPEVLKKVYESNYEAFVLLRL